MKVSKFVDGQVKELASDRGALAELRRGTGLQYAEASPLLLRFTLALDWDLDRVEGRRSLEASHAALTLFATRSGGATGDTAVKVGVNLGQALYNAGKARGNPVALEGVLRGLVSSRTLHELLSHLRRGVSLIKTASVGLDFGLLARDIEAFDLGGKARNAVLLQWSAAYYRATGLAAEVPVVPVVEVVAAVAEIVDIVEAVSVVESGGPRPPF